MDKDLFVLSLHESMVGDYRDAEDPWVQVCGEAYPATPSDLVSAVRRGVESGTIKGRVMRECEHGLLHEVDPDTEGWDLRCPFNDSDVPCQMSVTLVVPVSDGGSET